MSALDDLIISPFESVFDAMGMMRGATAPLKRALAGIAVGSAITYSVKPEFAFTITGTPKPWVATSPDAADATLIPWWMPGVLTGFVFGVFV